MIIQHPSLIKSLLALQAFEGLIDPPEITSSFERKIKRLRETLPVSVIMHHYSRRNRQKKSLTTANNGICGHCHIAFPKALFLQMKHGELGICPNCSGFIYIEPETTVEEIPVKARKSRKASLN